MRKWNDRSIFGEKNLPEQLQGNAGGLFQVFRLAEGSRSDTDTQNRLEEKSGENDGIFRPAEFAFALGRAQTRCDQALDFTGIGLAKSARIGVVRSQLDHWVDH